jgi:glycosyltransferase involved in cell wall biosynthesis
MIKTLDGKVFSIESSFSYPLFRRYLDHFDEVVIFARVRKGDLAEVILDNEISKDRVKVFELPYYVGFYQFVKTYINLRNAVLRGLDVYCVGDTATICRVPGRIGAEVIRILNGRQRAYAIEVVGDPNDVLSKGVMDHPLRPLIRFFSTRSLKRIARNAPVALYVTQVKLQERYPCKNKSFGASDVLMADECYISQPKETVIGVKLKLICIGSLEQMYKAPDVMIKAVDILVKWGLNVSLQWIGNGIYFSEMIQLVSKLGLSQHITFVGKLPAGAEVRESLDRSDIFVMPSRTEGLPRAMVEAMARGLPCVGTRICGIQELLPENCLVDINNAPQLADKIRSLALNPDLRKSLSELNLKKSKEYHESILGSERKKFFDTLKQLSR